MTGHAVWKYFFQLDFARMQSLHRHLISRMVKCSHSRCMDSAWQWTGINVGLLTSLSLSFFALFCLDFSNKPAEGAPFRRRQQGGSGAGPQHAAFADTRVAAGCPGIAQEPLAWLAVRGEHDCFKCACPSWKDMSDQLLTNELTFNESFGCCHRLGIIWLLFCSCFLNYAK